MAVAHRRSAAQAKSRDFELRHWRSSERKPPPPSIGRAAPPPAIEIPNGGSESALRRWGSDPGYISLCDIISSPEYAGSSQGACGASCAEIRISNPLVKHAAYAYLQPTPSASDAARRLRRRSPICRLLLACGVLFRPCFSFLGCLDDASPNPNNKHL